MKVAVEGEAGMARLGARLAGALQPGDAVLLSGEMGAGKSVLARGIARALGVTEAMPSPSFTILQGYEADMPIRHFDLYRLEDPAEFYEAGLDEQMAPNALSLVEWPERADFPSEPGLRVRIGRGASEDAREVEITASGLDGAREARLRAALSAYEREERGTM